MMQRPRRPRCAQDISQTFSTLLRGIACVICCLSQSPIPVYAFQSYLLQGFNPRYGTTGTRLDTCSICHVGPAPDPTRPADNPRNPYGCHFQRQANHSLNPIQALQDIEECNSDSSSITCPLGSPIAPCNPDVSPINNLAEILALAFPGNPNDEPPLADAGVNQNVDENSVVTLDGRASRDRDANGSQNVTFLWKQVGGPVLTDFLNRDSAQPTFTAPAFPSAPLRFELLVTDNEGSTGKASVSVFIVPANDPPTADAGIPQAVNEAVSVTLDGSKSSDPEDGATLQFAWSQPGGPMVVLSGSTSSRPTFIAPRVGGASVALEFALRVTDSGGLQDTDTVIVNVSNTNRPPTANAGTDQNVTEDDVVTLDGTGSRDPEDGAPVQFFWTQVAGPRVNLSNATVPQPTFVAPLVEAAGATLRFALRVTDSEGLAATDDVEIHVMDGEDDPARDSDADGLPDIVENTAPNSGDGNKDGVLDSQQAHVTTLPTSQNTRHVTLVAPQGTHLTSVRVVANPSPDDTPQRATFPTGFLEFMLHGMTPGAEAIVTLLLPPGITIDTYYKFGRTPALAVNHWYEFRFDGRTGVEITANAVRLHFVDGQRGDDDLTANGVIMDPGGVALGGSLFIDTGSDEGGGSGGGCVMYPGAPFDPLLMGVLGCILAYLGWQRRRRP